MCRGFSFCLVLANRGVEAVDYMARALHLAALARGQTSPNPMVGAVIVKDGRVIGEGYHHRAGQPHAEILALRAAGEQARGATIYVTLEPCCVFGRTPPCTQALITAGIAEVHAAMVDPNPRVAGNGLAELERAGIHTYVGERGDEARSLNEVFVAYMSLGRPFVIVKYAMSADGKIATRSGESRGLTGQDWQQQLHALRSQVDAILVGVNTVVADDPLLTVRTPEPTQRQPLRIVLDDTLRTPVAARLLAPSTPGKTLIVASAAASQERAAALRQQGAEVLVMPGSRIKVRELLADLGRREVTSVLVEGGGQVIASFVGERLIDKVIVVVAPVMIGGANAPTAVEGRGTSKLAQALRLEWVDVQRVGSDVVLTGYPS